MELMNIFEDYDWFDTLNDEVNRLLVGGKFPPITISVKDKNFLIRAELPGINAKDLNVTVAERTITIQGERKIEPHEGVVSFHEERNDGFFNRTIALPRDVDTSRAESVLSNGILTIALHKKDTDETKQISVKAG
ncbi:MAG: Hsp20/alpha crystallin family protein [Candidatus Scalinduaceae bacterium]